MKLTATRCWIAFNAIVLLLSLLVLPTISYGQEPPSPPTAMPPLPGVPPSQTVPFDWNQSFQVNTHPGPVVTVAVGGEVEIAFAAELADHTITRNFTGAPLLFDAVQSNTKSKLDCNYVEAKCKVSSDMLGTAEVRVVSTSGGWVYQYVNVIFVREWYTGRNTLILSADMVQTNDGQSNGLSVVFPREHSGQYEVKLFSPWNGEQKYTFVPEGAPMGKRLRVVEKTATPLHNTGEVYCASILDVQSGSQSQTTCGEIRGKYGYQVLKAEINYFGDLEIQAHGLRSDREYRVVLLRGDQFYLELERPLFESLGGNQNKLVFYKGMQGYEIKLPWGFYTVALVEANNDGQTFVRTMPDALRLETEAKL